jgi:poly(hydroxyalkanoate) depolymerase family esterase
MKLNHQLFSQLRAATQQLFGKGAGKGPAAATEAIQRALGGLNLGGARQAQAAPGMAPEAPPMRDINPPPGGAARAGAAPQADAASHTASQAGTARSGQPQPMPHMPPNAQAFVEDLLGQLGVNGGKLPSGLDLGNFEMPNFDLPGMKGGKGAPVPVPEGAQFISGSYTNHAGTRSYKLYIPSTYHGQAMPLLVMLHGCTQDPDDFAAGTQMNAVAEEKQCFVVYPAQSQQANNHKCWNWFNALDQQRGQGEPSIIAGIAQQVIAGYPVDERQVYVAGLSAGGAMAVIVGTLYPDLFAAVGVHSGLPYASAQDLPSALSAMKRGAPGNVAKAAHTEGASLPIIVFHGDQDRTVHPRNGEQVIEQKLRAHGVAQATAEADGGSVPNGHRYTVTTHRHEDGTPLGEHWVVHGAGHAWSGGSAAGSYTDGKGPDASREMMRFFRTVAG